MNYEKIYQEIKGIRDFSFIKGFNHDEIFKKFHCIKTIVSLNREKEDEEIYIRDSFHVKINLSEKDDDNILYIGEGSFLILEKDKGIELSDNFSIPYEYKVSGFKFKKSQLNSDPSTVGVELRDNKKNLITDMITRSILETKDFFICF